MDHMQPLFLAELNVESREYLRFYMPQQEVGRPDVEVTIEYGDAINGKQELVCNVWARIGNTSIRGFILPFHLPKPLESEKIERIISALNDEPNFLNQLDHFIDFMSQAK